MFGYKFEIWKYDSAQCEEAEKHLYEMAEKGYELISFDPWLWPIVFYKKSEKTFRGRYSVAMMPYDEKELVQLCDDSGWKLIGNDNMGMSVFFSEDHDVKPLFTDEETRTEMWKKMFETHKTGQEWLFPVGGALLMWIALGDAWKPSWAVYPEPVVPWYYAVSFVLILIFMALVSLSALIERRVIKNQYMALEEGLGYERPVWVSRFFSFKMKAYIILFVLFAVLSDWEYMQEALIPVLLLKSLYMLVFLVGTVLYTLKINTKLGRILVIIATSGFVMAGRLAVLL